MLLKMLFLLCSLFICLSQALDSDIVERYDISSSYDDIIGNGIASSNDDLKDFVLDSYCSILFVNITEEHALIEDYCGILKPLSFQDMNEAAITPFPEIITANSRSLRMDCNKDKGTVLHGKSIILDNGQEVTVTHPRLQCPCQTVNFSIVNDTVQDAVVTAPCNITKTNTFSFHYHGVTNLSFVTKIELNDVPIYQLREKDLTFFPNLSTLKISGMPLSSAALENGLFCQNDQLITLLLENSYGNLNVFPRQMFNCSKPMNLKYLYLRIHEIAILPDQAFLSAARHLTIISLAKLHLQVIEKDAFHGVLNLQQLYLEDSKVHILSGMLSIPSSELADLSLVNIAAQLLDLTTVLPYDEPNVEIFIARNCNLSRIDAPLCKKNKTSLRIVDLRQNSLMHFAHGTFHFCSSLRLVLAASNKLEYLDDDVFLVDADGVVGLDFADNELTDDTDWSSVLSKQQNLQYLNLSGNSLTSWKQPIINAGKLQVLDLSGNQITLVSQDAFINKTKLEFLSFKHNLLYQIESSMPAEVQLNSMTVVDISHNHLITLSPGIFSMCSEETCSLKVIQARNNSLSNVTLPCSSTHEFEAVDLSMNNFSNFNDIFPNVEQFPCSVKTLNISHNPFSQLLIANMDIMDWFTATYFHEIEKLDMSHCGLVVVELNVFTTFKIGYLDLSNNPIMFMTENSQYIIPQTIDLTGNVIAAACQNLWLKKMIDAENTTALFKGSQNLKQIPESLFVCGIECPSDMEVVCDQIVCSAATGRELVAVSCASTTNKTMIPSVLAKVPTRLSVHGFHLSSLKLPFSVNSSLTTLALIDNQIAEIQENTFTNVSNLQYLLLRNNNIDYIPRHLFRSLIHLVALDLSSNALSYISSDLIRHNHMLRNLNLHSNKLKTLSLDVLFEMERISVISLYDNPWKCVCNNSFDHWLVANMARLDNVNEIRCDGSGVSVIYSNVTCKEEVEVYIMDHTARRTIIPLVSSVAVVAVVMLVACCVMYKYRFFLAVVVYTYFPHCSRANTRSRLNQTPGIFSIYDDKERDAYMWVKDQLIPHVEVDEDSNCKIICSDRDFVPGMDVMDNVEDAIKNSDCCAMLLTENFLDNQWSRAMLQAVFCEIRERKRPYKIIPILWHGVTIKDVLSHELCPADLTNLLKSNRVLTVESRMFWEYLLYLLPSQCRPQNQTRMGTTSKTHILVHLLLFYVSGFIVPILENLCQSSIDLYLITLYSSLQEISL